MDYAQIRQCLDRCLFTEHARREMDTERLGRIQTDEVLQALENGEIIETYVYDVPYPSCLILGLTVSRRPLHVVCAPVLNEARLVIITTYEPDTNRWEPDLRRRKQ